MIIIAIVMAAGIVLGIFLGVLLLTLDRGNKQANRLFGLLMIMSSFIISDFAFSKFDLYGVVPHAIGIAPPVLFLIGPLFFFYAKIMAGEKVYFKGKIFFHFLPFTLLVLYRLPFFLQSAQTKLYLFNEDHFYKYEHKAIIIIQTIHALIYLFTVKKILRRHEKQLKETSSLTERININWLRRILNFISAIFGFIVIYFLILLAGLDLHPLYAAFIPLTISVMIVWIGFIGLKQPIIVPHENERSKGRKYERSTLTDEQADEYFARLLALMDEEKPYLDRELTLQKLAEHLAILSNHLSQVINYKTNQNFFDFINAYRIKEAQKLLVDQRGELLTILAIGVEVGFNSKSSFNSAFKKYTGKTPSEYKSEIQRVK